MEILLAIVVVTAVIFFGALISMGNERQRKAIDELRERATIWAIQDLQIKREALAREVKIDDPRRWLNELASKVYGIELNLQIEDAYTEPPSLLCSSRDGLSKMIFTPLSPADVRLISKRNNRKLNRFDYQNPLFLLPSRVTGYEFSTLNAGILFDLELIKVWRELTGQSLESVNRLWMYECR